MQSEKIAGALWGVVPEIYQQPFTKGLIESDEAKAS
jgi:hypothetical protein